MATVPIWKSVMQELVLLFGFFSGMTINSLVALDQGLVGYFARFSGSVFFLILVLGIILAVFLLSYSLGSVLGVASAILVLAGGIFALSFGWMLLGIGLAIGFAAPMIFHDPEKVDDKDELIFNDMHGSI